MSDRPARYGPFHRRTWHNPNENALVAESATIRGKPPGMRAAEPHELTKRALPVMTATISEAELEEWLPFRFQEITDPLAAAEPSRGALLQLDSGQYFVVYWGRDSGQLTVRIPEAVEPSFFLSSFFNEVSLPRERITWVRDGVRLPGPQAVASGRSRRTSMRPGVLIVEDDAHTREALRRILELEGLETDMAVNGEKALGALAQRDYDVILLDIALPKMRGIDLLRYLLSMRPRMLERVIVLTGLPAEEIRKMFPTVADTLSKPVMPGRLIAAIRRLGPRIDEPDYTAEPQVS